MVETILVLTLFNFLFIIAGIGIYIYKFIIKYVLPKYEAKRIEKEKLLEEHNKEKTFQDIVDEHTPIQINELKFKDEKEFQDYRNKVFGIETFIGAIIETTNEYGTKTSLAKYFTSNKEFIEWKKEIEKDPNNKVVEFTPTQEQFRDYFTNV